MSDWCQYFTRVAWPKWLMINVDLNLYPELCNHLLKTQAVSHCSCLINISPHPCKFIYIRRKDWNMSSVFFINYFKNIGSTCDKWLVPWSSPPQKRAQAIHHIPFKVQIKQVPWFAWKQVIYGLKNNCLKHVKRLRHMVLNSGIIIANCFKLNVTKAC